MRDSELITELALPFRDEVVTIGDMVHGGAISALVDARVIRRGSSLCFCGVKVSPTDGDLVASGLVTYKLG